MIEFWIDMSFRHIGFGELHALLVSCAKISQAKEKDWPQQAVENRQILRSILKRRKVLDEKLSKLYSLT